MVGPAIAGAMVALGTLGVGARTASAWHQKVTLQNAFNGALVSFAASGDAIPINAAIDTPLPVGEVTMLDLNLGELRDGDEVAFRMRDSRFVSRSGPGPVMRAALTLAPNAAGLPDIAPPFRFTLTVREPGGACPGAVELPPSHGPILPSFTPSHLISDGCLVSFAGQSLELFDASGVLAVRAAGSARDRAEVFRIRIIGWPDTVSLSAPFLEVNRFVPFAVHVDHLPHRGAIMLRCEDGYGRAPLEDHGRPCYPGHEGTDFPLRPISIGPEETIASVKVLAAAAGQVVAIRTGQFDRCYFNPIANCSLAAGCPDPNDYAKAIDCNHRPANGPGTEANVVVIAQDDGLIAEYVHLRNGSITVMPGQRVACGEVLGNVGSAGISSLPHLHFDLGRPLHIAREHADDKNRPPVIDDGVDNWGINAATQGSPRLVDPYDDADAGGRPTMWTELLPTSPSQLPKLVCSHPSQSSSSLLLGLPDGSPCKKTWQCRLARVCNSAMVCAKPVAAGKSCGSNIDCALSTCVSGVCTIGGLPPGASCGPGLVCGKGLSCINASCALPAPAGASDVHPECPPGMSKKCASGCNEQNGSCRTDIGNRGCGDKVCRP